MSTEKFGDVNGRPAIFLPYIMALAAGVFIFIGK